MSVDVKHRVKECIRTECKSQNSNNNILVGGLTSENLREPIEKEMKDPNLIKDKPVNDFNLYTIDLPDRIE